MSTFQSNLKRWAKKSPEKAFLLPYVDCTTLNPCYSLLNEPNLESIHGGFFYHDQGGTAQEASDWFSSLDLTGISVIFIYGVGLGYYYDAASEWLHNDRDHRLVFLEDELPVICHLFNTERGSRLLKDRQVQLWHFSDIESAHYLFISLYWQFPFARFIVSSLDSYQKHKSTMLFNLRHRITDDAAKSNAWVNEYLNSGVSYYRNFYPNLRLLPGSYLGNKLFGKFKKVPAIICGAGPSLKKHFQHLKGVESDALIFAGGSGLNALHAAGIRPHFGAGIDPNPTQLERVIETQECDVPFFFKPRIYHEALKLIRGPRLYVTGSSGYDTPDFFEKELNIDEEAIDEGHNVVNLCVDIAHSMGCDPIIFVGMDLAYTNNQSYAPGVVPSPEHQTDHQIDKSLNWEDRPFIKDDIYGQPTLTEWKWVIESEWIGEFAKKHPETTMINCTEGGIGFPGVPNQPFDDVVEHKLSEVDDLQKRIEVTIAKSAMKKITLPKINNAIEKLKISLESCIEKLNSLIKLNQTNPLAEIELQDEDGYRYVLHIFDQVYTRLVAHKKQSQRKRYRFLRQVALDNIEIINSVM